MSKKYLLQTVNQLALWQFEGNKIRNKVSTVQAIRNIFTCWKPSGIRTKNSKFCKQKRNSCERIRKIRKNEVTTSFWIRDNELVILNS